MTLVFARQVALCRRWLAKATPVKSERILTLFESCCKQMRIKPWLTVTESPAVSGPFLIGVIRPTLLLPSGMTESATDTQLRTVFLHELAHLKRWDVWTGWLATFLLILHWFNPMLWLAIRRMNADREEASDALASQTLNENERTDYVYSLLDIAEMFTTPKEPGTERSAVPGLPGLVGISETSKFLTRRIDMINQNRTWKLRWKILALIAVVCIGAMTLTNAQEKRKAAEIQADIAKLQTELQEAKQAEGIADDDDDEWVLEFYRVLSINLDLLVESLEGTRITRGVDGMISVEAPKAEQEKVKEMIAKLQKAETAAAPQPPIILEKAEAAAAPQLPIILEKAEAAAAPQPPITRFLPATPGVMPMKPGAPMQPGGSVMPLDAMAMPASGQVMPVAMPGSSTMMPGAPQYVMQQAPEVRMNPFRDTLPNQRTIVEHKVIMAGASAEKIRDALPPDLRSHVVGVDVRTNSIIIQGTPADLDKVKAAIDETEKKLAESLTFKAYPLPKEGDANAVLYLLSSILDRNPKAPWGVATRVPNPSAEMEVDPKSKLLFVMGSKSDHETIKAVVDQIREQKEPSAETIAANKPFLRGYTLPADVESGSIFHFINRCLAGSPDAKLGGNYESLEESDSFYVWGRQSDHAKVKDILDQIAAAKK